MATAKQIADNLRRGATLPKLQEKAAEVIDRDKGQILKQAKINELERGLRPDGQPIGLYRNPNYAKYKNILNPRAGLGKVDLILTGAFANSLFTVRRGKGTFSFDASNTKAPALFEKYGQDNRGLSDEAFNEYQNETLAPEIAEYIKQVMNGR